MSTIKQHIDDYVNIANNNIAASVGNFFNNIEDVKLIVTDNQKSIIDEQLAIIDTAVKQIFDLYKANINSFVKSHFRVIYAAEKLSQGKAPCKKM